MTDVVQKGRIAKAVAVVIALLAFVPASGLVVERLDDAACSPSDAPGFNAAQVIGGRDPLGMLERLEEMDEATGVDLPASFDGEVGLVDGARDVRVGEGGCVVGCVLDCDAPQAFRRVDEHMRAKGWAQVSLGGVEGATYVKQGGDLRWTLVTCTQVGAATSMVFRCTGA